MKYRIQTTDMEYYLYKTTIKKLLFWEFLNFHATLEDALETVKKDERKRNFQPTVLFEGSYEEILQAYSQRTQQ